MQLGGVRLAWGSPFWPAWRIAPFLFCLASSALAMNPQAPVSPGLVPIHLTLETREDLISRLQSAGFPPEDTPTIPAPKSWSGLEVTLLAALGPGSKVVVYQHKYPKGFVGWASSGVVGVCVNVHLTGWYKQRPALMLHLDGLYCPSGKFNEWASQTQTARISIKDGGPPLLPEPGPAVTEIGPGGPN